AADDDRLRTARGDGLVYGKRGRGNIQYFVDLIVGFDQCAVERDRDRLVRARRRCESVRNPASAGARDEALPTRTGERYIVLRSDLGDRADIDADARGLERALRGRNQLLDRRQGELRRSN